MQLCLLQNGARPLSSAACLFFAEFGFVVQPPSPDLDMAGETRVQLAAPPPTAALPLPVPVDLGTSREEK